MAGKIPLLLFSLLTLLAAVNNNSMIFYIMYITFQLILALFILIFYAIRSPEFKNALELELTRKERRKEINSATQLTTGLPYKAGIMVRQAGGGASQSLLQPYVNTSSSETSKPNSDNMDSNRRSKIYKVNRSDSDCSEDDPLMYRARKANKKLRSMKFPGLGDPEHSSQSGVGKFGFCLTRSNVF